jgi:hypothetical protein
VVPAMMNFNLIQHSIPVSMARTGHSSSGVPSKGNTNISLPA